MRYRHMAGLVVILCAPALAGCGGGPKAGIKAFYAASYEEAVVEIEPFAEEEGRNYVLNNLRLGSAAMAAGQWEIAQRGFGNAAEVIEAFATNTAGQKVAALVGRESARVFKGEPYERAMAWYYYGLTFYREGDYDNARAAFANALFDLEAYSADDKGNVIKDKDGNPVAERVENSFVLAYFFLGRCYLRLGDDARARSMFARAGELAPEVAATGVFDQETNARGNLVIVVEDGYGPVKYATGPDKALIDFRPGFIPSGLPDMRIDDKRMQSVNTVNLYVLATERQWQSFDTWRLSKSVAGTAMMAAGAGMMAMSDDRSTQMAGAAVMLVGAIAKATAKADDRHWELLPARVSICIARVREGKYDFQAGYDFYGAVPVAERPDTLLYFRVNTVARVRKDINALRAEKQPAQDKAEKKQ